MTISQSANVFENNKKNVSLLLALIVAGLAGNYFNFPIFLNINFLYGSTFAMLALQFFGLGRGILAAAIIACYTYILWNHPYAIITMTAEVALVGWQMERRKMGMVLADTLYWLLIGMPLVYLFYHFVMLVPTSHTYISMIKLAINGIANALVARLIFTAYALRSRSSLISYREIVYNLMAFFVLCPALIMLAVESRTDFNETDRHIRTTLTKDSQRVTDIVETWVVNRKSAILNLAEMAASRSPQQMQPYLEQAKKSDVNFLRIGLQDRKATSIAYFPPVDELGQNNIGKNFADRPSIPQLKRTLKPILSEVVMSRIGTPKPTIAMLAPVVIRGEYSGYVAGILSLQQIRVHLDKNSEHNATFYTLIDKNGNVIMTNRTDQTMMTPYEHGKGTLSRLEAGISQWVPFVSTNTPFSERWKKSFYIAENAIGDLAEWKLVLEQPVAPFQKTLYDNYSGKLTLLFLILLGALTLAELLSRRIVVTLGRLSSLTYELPVRLATDGKEIAWPESGIKEANHLITNFREMADSLSEQFIKTRQINESLERRVEERTIQLATIMHERNIILENAPIGISKVIDRKQVWVNRKTEELFLYSKEELEFQTTRKLYPSDEVYEKQGQEPYVRLAQGLVFETVQELVRKDCVHILVRSIGKAVDPQDLSKGTLWLMEDVTERKVAEDALRQSEEKYRAMIEAFDGYMYICSQGFRIEFMNDKLIQRTGRNATGEYCYKALHDLDAVCEWCVNEQVFAGKSVRWEVKSPKDDRWYEVNNLPVYNANGTISKQALIVDITDRMRLEEVLRESEERFRLLVEHAPDAIYIQTDGLFSYVNQTSLALFGAQDEDDLLGNPIMERIHPDFHDAVRERIKSIKSELQSASVLAEQYLMLDGTAVDVEVSAVPFDYKGEQGALVFVRDITERKQADQKLQKKNAEIEQFIYTVSHDLRSPLVTVKTFLGFLEDDMVGSNQERVTQDLQFLHSAADKMKMLLDELLELSRIDRIETESVKVSLSEVLTEVLDALAGIIAERKVDIRRPDTDLILFGDRPRLSQIWQNLIENAIKYSRDDSIPRIELGVQLMSGETVFFVKDNGIGIAPEYHAKIFGIFEKLDQKSPGAGMGLSMIRRIVEKCGGRVWVESNGDGSGSCFKFTQPGALYQ